MSSLFFRSDARAVLGRAAQRGLARILLATDLDNTLVMTWPGDRQPDTQSLLRHLEERDVVLMGVTGMSWSAVVERMKTGDIPPLSIVATSVGTELRLAVDAADTGPASVPISTPHGTLWYEIDQEYTADVDRIGFDKEAVERIVANVVARTTMMEVEHPPAQRTELQFQVSDSRPPSGSAPHIGLWAFDETPGSQRVQTLAAMLKRETGHSIAWCEEKQYNSTLPPGQARRRYCIDVLACSKDRPVRYVSRALQPDTVVVAGDSGNDYDLLTQVGDLKIVVGGATADLRDRVSSHIEAAPVAELSDGATSGDPARGFAPKWFVDADERSGPESILRGLQALEG